MSSSTRQPAKSRTGIRFNRDLIGELHRLLMAHNEATADPARHVTIDQLKGLYKQHHTGKDPQARALAKLREHLERLRRQVDMPPPVKANAVLLPNDFLEALKSAGVTTHPSETALFQAAATVYDVAQRLISAHFFSPIGQIREVGDRLGEIEAACLLVFSLIGLPPLGDVPEETVLDALVHQLSRSRNATIVALVDAAGGDAGGCRRLARSLLENARLASHARAAREQFEAGRKREKVSRKDPAARSPARALGFALIESYLSLSGEQPSFSRTKPEDKGQPAGSRPTGPLIRYLTHLFERARHVLSLNPESAALPQQREWNPSPETLAAWIQQFRAGDPDL